MTSVDAVVATLVRDQCACLNTRKAARVLTNAYDAALAPAGLRLTQFSLLAHVRALGRTSVTALAVAMDLDQTTVSRNVEQLRKLKLLSTSRTRPHSGACAYCCWAKPALDRAYPLWERRQSAFVAGVGGEAEWSKLRNDLARLSNNG